MPKSKITFRTYQYADVGTAYLEESDLNLLNNPDCPTRFAETDDKGGSFHYVCHDAADWRRTTEEARQFGLSDRFIRIMTAAREQGIPYVRFDAAGSEVHGLDYGSAGRDI